MILVTIYALFSDDFRVLATPQGADDYFYSLTCVAFVLFMSEIILSIIVKDNYFGFYFWLDIVSTLSLITDIGWFMDAITGTSKKAKSAKQAT